MVSDPRCPECNGAVGTTATYCMHCGAEFERPVGVDGDAGTDTESVTPDEIDYGATTDVDSASEASAGVDEARAGEVEGPTTAPDAGTTDRTDGATASRSAGGDQATGPELTTWEERLDAWLAPDGWLDNSLTIVIAIVAGLFVGPLALFVVGALTESIWALPVGLVAWIGSTVYFARQRTVYGAVRGGCYTVAGLFVVLPPAVAIAGSGGLAGRVGAFIAFEIFALFFAVPLFAVGKVASHLREKKVASADQSKGPTGRDNA